MVKSVAVERIKKLIEDAQRVAQLEAEVKKQKLYLQYVAENADKAAEFIAENPLSEMTFVNIEPIACPSDESIAAMKRACADNPGMLEKIVELEQLRKTGADRSYIIKIGA